MSDLKPIDIDPATKELREASRLAYESGKIIIDTDLLEEVIFNDAFYLPWVSGSGTAPRNPVAEFLIAEIDAANKTGDWTRVNRASFLEDDYTQMIVPFPYVETISPYTSDTSLLGMAFLHERYGVPLTPLTWRGVPIGMPSSVPEACGFLQYLIDKHCPLPENVADVDVCATLIWDIEQLYADNHNRHSPRADEDVQPALDLLAKLIDLGFTLPDKLELEPVVPQALSAFLVDRGVLVTHELL